MNRDVMRAMDDLIAECDVLEALPRPRSRQAMEDMALVVEDTGNALHAVARAIRAEVAKTA